MKRGTTKDAIDTLDRFMWALGGAMVATSLLAIGYWMGRWG
jgi:hypothetical protein